MRAATGEMRRYLQQKQQQLAGWLAGWLTDTMRGCIPHGRTDGREDGWRPSVENVRKERGVWVVVVVVV